MTKFLSNSIVMILLLLITCSACSEKEKAELLLEVENIEINSWLDLMPGVSPGKFHLTGEVTLKNLGDKDVNDISLNNITVYSSEENIYTFKPYFKNKSEEDNFNLKKGMTKVFRFGLEEGLKIDGRISTYKMINIKLKFVSGKGSYYYLVNNVEVEEAH
jgi:hypothetical protein